MNNVYGYDWLWVLWALYFAVVEGIALWHNRKSAKDWTLTHFIRTVIPISMRVPLLAWLVFHFLSK